IDFYSNTRRQRKNRKNELPEKHQECISSVQNRKLRKIAAETTEEPVIIATNQTDESITTSQSEENTATIPQNDDNIVETN
ncbi:16326_t:CDS:2, partial [Racocetra fulgida]